MAARASRAMAKRCSVSSGTRSPTKPTQVRSAQTASRTPLARGDGEEHEVTGRDALGAIGRGDEAGIGRVHAGGDDGRLGGLEAAVNERFERALLHVVLGDAAEAARDGGEGVVLDGASAAAAARCEASCGSDQRARSVVTNRPTKRSARRPRAPGRWCRRRRATAPGCAARAPSRCAFAAQEDLELRVELAPGAIDERLLRVEGAGVVGVAEELRLAGGGHEVEPAVQRAARLDHVDGDGVVAVPIGEQPAVELVGGEARARVVEPRGHGGAGSRLGRRRRRARRDADGRCRARRTRGRRRRCDEQKSESARLRAWRERTTSRCGERGGERVVQPPVGGEDLAAVAAEGPPR